MADMNKKHVRLISDALIEGLLAAEQEDMLGRKVDDPLDRETIMVSVASKLAETVAHKLRYTHDNFDHTAVTDFKNEVVRGVQGGIHEIAGRTRPRRKRVSSKIQNTNRSQDMSETVYIVVDGELDPSEPTLATRNQQKAMDCYLGLVQANADELDANDVAAKSQYENGECPDCGEPIPEDAGRGGNCANCEHVWAWGHVDDYDGPCIYIEGKWYDLVDEEGTLVACLFELELDDDGDDSIAPYKTLNDCACHFASRTNPLSEGNVEVWYMKPKWFRQGIMGENPNPHDLSATHVLLGKVTTLDPEFIFRALQGENWSPTGEARELIRAKGLEHTSMSVGDCIRIADGGNEVYIVREPAGFEQL